MTKAKHTAMMPQETSPAMAQRGAELRYAVETGSLGAVLVAASARGLAAILLGNTDEALIRDLRRRFPAATLCTGDREIARWAARVVAFIEAPQRGLDLPLDPTGTDFERRVWQALGAIPPGAVASYGEIAARIGAPGAARAVARACAANPLAVAIPCHRIRRADGAPGGYRWGLARKAALLAREAAA